MTALELRKEIDKTINEIPEHLLLDVLLFLRNVKMTAPDEHEGSAGLNRIMAEDQELFIKLVN
jgi:hypothetical protein